MISLGLGLFSLSWCLVTNGPVSHIQGKPNETFFISQRGQTVAISTLQSIHTPSQISDHRILDTEIIHTKENCHRGVKKTGKSRFSTFYIIAATINTPLCSFKQFRKTLTQWLGKFEVLQSCQEFPSNLITIERNGKGVWEKS